MTLPPILLLLAALQAPDTPFAAGPQWHHAPQATQPWIPDGLAFVELEPGAGELVWAARAFQSPGVLLLGAQEEAAGGPLLADGDLSGALFPPQVASSGGRAFVAHQQPDPEGRRTVVERRSPSLGTPGVLWSQTTAPVDGGADLAARGDGLVLVERLASAGAVRLTSLDPAAGLVRASIDLPGGTLRALDLSADGRRALVLAGERLYLIDTASGATLLARTHQPAPRSAALSAGGERIALGRAGQVELWSDTPGDLAPSHTIAGLAAELPVALAFDAELLAIGWWNSVDARTLSLELWEVPPALAPSLSTGLVVPPVSGSPQNFVADVALAGGRAAFGLWGGTSDEPEVVLLERGAAAPLLSADLDGSVRGIALDPAGERVAVARKDGHANFFSTTGAVELLDTGERDLALGSSPKAGAPLSISVAAPPSSLALLAVGAPILPAPFPLLGGSLALDPSAPLLLLPFEGRGSLPTLDLTVPPAASGLPFALQAVFLEPAGVALLGRTAVRSQIL